MDTRVFEIKWGDNRAGAIPPTPGLLEEVNQRPATSADIARLEKLLSEKTEASVKRQHEIRVPKKTTALKRWRETWRSVRGMWNTTQNYTEITDWHNKAHPKLKCSVDTMSDIIKAGEAGLLDK